MVLCIKVVLNEAQKTRQDLQKKGLVNQEYAPKKEKNHLFIPVTKKFETSNAFVNKKLEEIQRKNIDFKEALKDKLTKEELTHLKTAFDHVGTIAILEVDDVLESKEKMIAKTLLKINNQIKTVLKKAGSHEGEFRTQKMKYLAGVNTKETLHKENNVTLKLNVEEVYFSPRLSNERKRIMQLVKPDEDVLVMFCGCAPYPSVLAKNTQAKHIYGIEINPVGHKYGLENVKLNKLKNVTLINGDVNKEAPKLGKKFDRILMPLPKSAEDFLDAALIVAKKGTIIHFYDFLNEKEFDLAKEKIKKACEKNKLKYKILELVKCGQHAPHVFRICIDFEIV